MATPKDLVLEKLIEQRLKAAERFKQLYRDFYGQSGHSYEVLDGGAADKSGYVTLKDLKTNQVIKYDPMQAVYQDQGTGVTNFISQTFGETGGGGGGASAGGGAMGIVQTATSLGGTVGQLKQGFSNKTPTQPRGPGDFFDLNKTGAIDVSQINSYSTARQALSFLNGEKMAAQSNLANYKDKIFQITTRQDSLLKQYGEGKSVDEFKNLWTANATTRFNENKLQLEENFLSAQQALESTKANLLRFPMQRERELKAIDANLAEATRRVSSEQTLFDQLEVKYKANPKSFDPGQYNAERTLQQTRIEDAKLRLELAQLDKNYSDSVGSQITDTERRSLELAQSRYEKAVEAAKKSNDEYTLDKVKADLNGEAAAFEQQKTQLSQYRTELGKVQTDLTNISQEIDRAAIWNRAYSSAEARLSDVHISGSVTEAYTADKDGSIRWSSSTQEKGGFGATNAEILRAESKLGGAFKFDKSGLAKNATDAEFKNEFVNQRDDYARRMESEIISYRKTIGFNDNFSASDLQTARDNFLGGRTDDELTADLLSRNYENTDAGFEQYLADGTIDLASRRRLSRSITKANAENKTAVRNDEIKLGIELAAMMGSMFGAYNSLQNWFKDKSLKSMASASGLFAGMAVSMHMVHNTIHELLHQFNSDGALKTASFVNKFLSGDSFLGIKKLGFLGKGMAKGLDFATSGWGIAGVTALLAFMAWRSSREKSSDETALEQFNQEVAPSVWSDGPVIGIQNLPQLLLGMGVTAMSLAQSIAPSAPDTQHFTVPQIQLTESLSQLSGGSMPSNAERYGSIFVLDGGKDQPTRIVYLTPAGTDGKGNVLETANVVTLGKGVTVGNPSAGGYIPFLIKDKKTGDYIPNPQAEVCSQLQMAMVRCAIDGKVSALSGADCAARGGTCTHVP